MKSFLILAAFFLGACASQAPKEGLSPLASRGESIYKANCIVCHNPDSTKDGSLGPAIHGASLDLLQARVVQGTYPEGYSPKRDSHLMPAMPHLAKEIEALRAYLTQ